MSAPPPPPKLPPPSVKPRLPPVVANAKGLTDALSKIKDVPRRIVDPTAQGMPVYFPKRTRSDFSGDALRNETHEWLVYESIFNHPQFEHGADRQGLGAYAFPLGKLRVVLAQNLPTRTLDSIRTMFLPALQDNAMLEAASFRPWVPAYKPDVEAKTKQGHVAHLPYNFVANDSSGKALGTRAVPVPPSASAAKKLAHEWSMWQTASRSCVVELKSSVGWAADPKAPAVVEDDKKNKFNVLPWKFRLDAAPVIKASASTVKRVADINTLPNTAWPVRFGTDANVVPLCAGIKTGVVWVGKVNQNTSTSEKGTLEKDALAAALRSDYVLALEAHLLDKVSPATAVGHQIIVLPELLTVTCTDATIDGGAGDGFQLRDLSRLDRAAHYFPPLSIPYVGRSAPFVQAQPVNFDVRSDYFAGLAGNPAETCFWANFWASEFASRIGQAKAVLHLVYGLQPLTPNAQNFLLEFSDKTMQDAGRVVVRDILDMKLHSDWVATVLSDRPYTDVSPVSLATLAGHFKGPIPVVQLLHYEATTPSIVTPGGRSMIVDSETHAAKADAAGRTQYFAGTQLNFFPYTALHRGSSVASPGSQASAGPPRAAGWQLVLYTNAVWGLAHAIDYAALINSVLGLTAPIAHAGFRNTVPLGAVEPYLLGRLKGVAFCAPGGRNVVVGVDKDATAVAFDFDVNAASIRDLKDTDEDFKRAGELHMLFCQWERAVSAVIHSAIYGTPDGRKRLREFHGLR
ncbi:hypothetical protein K438DRAFT_2145851 [Mycena galopus ATCC 62051]|nr:hypothetical protein K438DRAFT_2145851 [Mycena galopus ATCC 62051]